MGLLKAFSFLFYIAESIFYTQHFFSSSHFIDRKKIGMWKIDFLHHSFTRSRTSEEMDGTLPLVIPSAFICIGKYLHIFFSKKILILSQATWAFEFPYLVMDNLSVLSIS